MWNSTYLSAKLLVWKTQGTLKMQVQILAMSPSHLAQEMLAKMGIPLHQCKQSYTYMTPSLRSADRAIWSDLARHHFRQQIISQVAEDYGLKDPSAVYKVRLPIILYANSPSLSTGTTPSRIQSLRQILCMQ
jgi:AraC-like DNA-binding protein